MLGDVDGNGSLDAVVAVTSSKGEGQVWAVSAATGETLQNFPVRLNNRCGTSASVRVECGVWCVACGACCVCSVWCVVRGVCFAQIVRTKGYAGRDVDVSVIADSLTCSWSPFLYSETLGFGRYR